MRLKSAWALSQIEDTHATPAIETALRQEQSPEVKKALIRALVHSGGHAEQTLGEFLHSSDPEVRRAVVRALAGDRIDPWPMPEPRPQPFP